jgi:hypothetical protein
MINEDVIDLYSRVDLGTKVVVLPMTHRAPAAVAQSRPSSMSSSYAPVSAPAAAWDGIRVRGVY